MWTKENRGRHDRSQQRYPRDLTAEEWRLVEPLIPPAKRGGGKRSVDMREVVNGRSKLCKQRLRRVMYIPSTGCQWRHRRKTCRRNALFSGISIFGTMMARCCAFIMSSMSCVENRLAAPPVQPLPSSTVKA
jgi:Putative transposase of IS4/5 family (DUF4096)